MSIQFLCLLFKWIICILFCYVGYLYSLDINPLLDTQFRIFYIEEICI